MIYKPSTHYTPDYHQGSPRQQGWCFTHIPQALSPSSEAVLLFLSTWLFTRTWQSLGGAKCDNLLPSRPCRSNLRQSYNSDENSNNRNVLWLLSTIYGRNVARTLLVEFTSLGARKSASTLPVSYTCFLPTCNVEQSQTHPMSVHLRSQWRMVNFMNLDLHIPWQIFL